MIEPHETPDDWTPEQKAPFSRMFRHMIEAQPMFTHPTAPRIAGEHWTTVCWNAVWFAVVCARDAQIGEVRTMVHIDSESGEVLGSETPEGQLQ